MNSTGYARFARRLPHSSRDCPVRLVPNPCDLVHIARYQVQEPLRRRGGTSGLGPRTHPRQRAGVGCQVLGPTESSRASFD
jgi:hypothetical protein